MNNIPPKLFVATKAIIVHKGKVLMLREAPTNPDGTQVGLLQFPGGRLNPGEDVYDGLKREVREETGLEATPEYPVAVKEWRPHVRGEDWQIVAIFFACTVELSEITLSEEHDAYEWADPNDYQNLNIADNLHSVFEAYLKL